MHDAVNRLPVPVNLHLAMDGHQALLMLSNPHFQPDLIVLDLNIPKISGTAFLELWGNEIPVVVLSSSMNPAARELCLALGAREFVTKPVELEEFQEAVGRIIEQWGARLGYGKTQADLKLYKTRMPDPPATLQQRETELIADFMIAKIVGKGDPGNQHRSGAAAYGYPRSDA